MKFRVQLNRARHNFYKISNNPSLVMKLFIFRTALTVLPSRMIITKQKWKRLPQVSWSSSIWKLKQKFFIIPSRQNQFFQENICNNGPVRPIAVATNTKSAFTRSNTENAIWYRQFDLRGIRIFTCGQPNVALDAANNCCLNPTTRKPMNLQDYIPSIAIG